MKIAPTASYNAVPSILIVAPIGSTNRVTRLSTPRLSSKHENVTGNVAELELVPKAVNNAFTNPPANLNGFLRVHTAKIAGNTMNEWIISPTMTVTMYKARLWKVCSISSMDANLATIRLQIPTGEYHITHPTTVSYTHLTLPTILLV